jgi:hypothetical protein
VRARAPSSHQRTTLIALRVRWRTHLSLSRPRLLLLSQAARRSCTASACSSTRPWCSCRLTSRRG